MLAKAGAQNMCPGFRDTVPGEARILRKSPKNRKRDREEYAAGASIAGRFGACYNGGRRGGNSMKKILLLATGGTIASTRTDEGGLGPELTAEKLLECVPDLEQHCHVDCRELFRIDSTNMTPHTAGHCRYHPSGIRCL